MNAPIVAPEIDPTPTGRIITLNFHGIGTPRRPLESGEERFWVGEEHFRDIVAMTRRHPRFVELTFDDANASDYDVAFPYLMEYGIRARFFLITDRIDAPGSLSSAQIAHMAAVGMRFGTHGATHRPWPGLAARGELGRELDDSARRIEGLTGRRVAHAAFPQGLYDRAVLNALKRRRYERAYSVDEGWSRDRAWLRTRYSVIHSDTARSVSALLDSPNLTAGPWPVRPLKQAVKRWR
jgi:peptidoglycan/xylan/chitin deacetylase (PgdA/CDA1 family)